MGSYPCSSVGAILLDQWQRRRSVRERKLGGSVRWTLGSLVRMRSIRGNNLTPRRAARPLSVWWITETGERGSLGQPQNRLKNSLGGSGCTPTQLWELACLHLQCVNHLKG